MCTEPGGEVHNGMYFVYIMKCGDGTLYTGVARNVEARALRHAVGRGSKYVRSRGAGPIVYQERRRTLALALRREAEIKTFNRTKKAALIADVAQR